jgi:hypothetical protein
VLRTAFLSRPKLNNGIIFLIRASEAGDLLNNKVLYESFKMQWLRYYEEAVSYQGRTVTEK